VEGDSGHSARELLIARKKERTAQWTHYCCHAARVLFLFSHGLVVVIVSTHLEQLDQFSWWTLFTPAWIGDALCSVFIVAAWFASCPYIQLCMSERAACVGDHPSILTEVLPEIILAILTLPVLLLTFFSEYALCRLLESRKAGKPVSLPTTTVLTSIVAILAICHGALLKHNSALFLIAGTAFCW